MINFLIQEMYGVCEVQMTFNFCIDLIFCSWLYNLEWWSTSLFNKMVSQEIIFLMIYPFYLVKQCYLMKKKYIFKNKIN